MENFTFYELRIIQKTKNPDWKPSRPMRYNEPEEDNGPQFFEAVLSVNLTEAQVEEVKKAVIENWCKPL